MADLHGALAQLFLELVNGVPDEAAAFMLNPGDAGLHGSLDRLSAEEASHSVDGGATIAAHAAHLRYGLSLMNHWSRDGGNPFADATWDEAWKIRAVDRAEWDEIRSGLREETARWTEALRAPRELAPIELLGTIGSIAHLAYHLGAIRQIDKGARGPRQETS